MSELIKTTTQMWMQDRWLRILTIAAIILLLLGFFAPPIGIIDNSVLIALGELSFFGVLFQVSKAIDKGTSVKASKGDTSISIHQDDADNDADVDCK